jgi:DNA-binding MarR family transcriptional regulator
MVRVGKAQRISDQAEETAEVDDQIVAEEVLRSMALSYNEEMPDSDPDAIEVVLALIRTMRVHRTAVARYIDFLDLPVAMTGARYTLLMTLYFSRENLLPQNKISRELNVSRTNITNLIDGLERDGLVERVPSPIDRRVSYAQLTDAGRKLCIELMPPITRLNEDLTRDFTSEERVQLKEFLYRVQRNVVKAHPGPYARGLGIGTD